MDAVYNNNDLDTKETNLSASEEYLTFHYTLSCLYILFGGLSLIANGIIIAVFLLNARFRNRKELLLLVGLAFADLIYGIGFSAIACRQIIVKSTYVTRWECLTLYEQMFLAFAIQASPLMTLCVSVDRLIAVRWLQFYNGLSRMKYVLCTVGSIFAFTTFSCVVGIAVLGSDSDNCRYSNVNVKHLTERIKLALTSFRSGECVMNAIALRSGKLITCKLRE